MIGSRGIIWKVKIVYPMNFDKTDQSYWLPDNNNLIKSRVSSNSTLRLRLLSRYCVEERYDNTLTGEDYPLLRARNGYQSPNSELPTPRDGK